MTKTFDEWQSIFASASIRDLAIYVARGMDGKELNEVTAVYARFVALAFHDELLAHHDRALAACWARVVESMIRIVLEGQSDTLNRFLLARNSSLKLAAEWGYGSVGFIATHEPSNLFEKTFAADGEDSARNEERDRRNFLMSAAFGREIDVA